ncbi:hypothetical protein [Paenibacillus aceris]|uniref:Rod shape-determining protein MreD n=1 Tax=Paenibacillus aceris TaxID=869555 RepID=A0ABS4HZJ4_9BACL|nr:hypothetical protein [Paenibacillus aceris]MBP1964060.1 hypothetical protein [Paenibacillus aceris]NHW34525.1 hypothetical protein [Paenibacillus aceris]
MNDVIVYDNRFNANEWFVIAMIVLGLLTIRVLPKKFTPTQTWFTLLTGVVFGLIFDHTIGVPPFDFYDVGDQSNYQLFDIFSYAMYVPFGYLFIYIYKRLGLKGFYTIPYIMIWTLMSVGIEWLCLLVGVFHYKHGYQILYSIPIYLFIQSIHLLLFHIFFPEHKQGE